MGKKPFCVRFIAVHLPKPGAFAAVVPVLDKAAHILGRIAEEKSDLELLTPEQLRTDGLAALDAVALGCPAMGSEVLEEMEFQPMFDACKRSLGGKRVALFGSYGWGDGEWMRTWESDCDSAGVNLVCESVICTETPDDAALEACRALGKALAE